jgi:hypothetical protein
MLMTPVHATLAAMAYLLIKHAAADFFLQTDAIFREKGHYGAGGGLLHAFIHIMLTAPVFFLFPGGTPQLAAMILAGEFLFHYHIDWTKEQVNKRMQWTPEHAPFWWTLGVDQFLHGATYVAIVALLMAGRGG